MQSSVLLLSLVLIISSCSSLKVLSGGVKTTQSYNLQTIFLSHENLEKKRIFINFRNASIFKQFDLTDNIKTRFLEREGVEIVSRVQDANIILQVNLRYYGVFDKDLLQTILEDFKKKQLISEHSEKPSEMPDFGEYAKFESANKYDFDIFAPVIGAMAGFWIFGGIKMAAIGAVVAAGGNIVLENFSQSKTIMALLDVEIAEKSAKGVKVYEWSQTRKGDGGFRKTEQELNLQFKSYQTKIIIVSKNRFHSDERAVNDVKEQIIAAINGII